jgi:hypothetical protein
MVEFDAVYPFHGDNFELSQSVRLLRKFTNVKNIYIVGDDPGIDGVIHVPFIQVDAKELNIWKKVLAACFRADLSKRFLFMNDDHFITKPTEDIPYYFGEFDAPMSNTQYQNAVQRTIFKLAEMGKTTRYFDIHYPFFVEKHRFLEVFKAFNDGKEYVFKTAYCNYWGIEGEFSEDKKIKFLANTEQIEKFVGDSWCFSTDMISADLKEYILQL